MVKIFYSKDINKFINFFLISIFKCIPLSVGFNERATNLYRIGCMERLKHERLKELN